MKVSSPVGEFPFEPDRLRLAGGRLKLEGHIGAWPAYVEMGPADGLRVARLASPVLLAPALGGLIVALLLRRSRRGRPVAATGSKSARR
jgi:hypothetical protein